MSSTVRFSQGLREALAAKRAEISGFFFSASTTIAFDSTNRTITRSTGSFIVDGFKVGDRLFIKNSTSNLNDTANTSPKLRVASVTALVMTLDTGDTLVTQSAVANLIIMSIKGGSLADLMHRCRFDVRDGSQPANADAAASGNLLITYTDNGGTYSAGDYGCEWEVAGTGGALTKKSTQTWRGTVAVTGTMGYARLTAPGDDNAGASTTAKRIDMRVGATSPADMTGSISVTLGQTRDIGSGSISIPASGA